MYIINVRGGKTFTNFIDDERDRNLTVIRMSANIQSEIFSIYEIIEEEFAHQAINFRFRKHIREQLAINS